MNCGEYEYIQHIVGNARRKPLGRLRRRWLHKIKMDFREVGWYFMDWSDLVQDKVQLMVLVKTVMKLRLPLNVNFLSSCTTDFSRRD
jgi:hypothetical protein